MTHRQQDPSGDSAPQRLQKVLAAAGYGSRRQCEELIATGRVEVDGQIVTELGTKVDPQRQSIRVDGEPVRVARFVYYMLNKPAGVVCTARDPGGRPRVIDLVPERPRVFPVGRLDLHSEGLILLTNDGALANRLAHPRFGVEKVYLAQVAGLLSRDEVQQLLRGMYLAEGFARIARLRIRKRHKQSTWVEMVLNQGRNRQIRRMMARLGHKVMKLRRIGFGPLRLGSLPVGAYRELTPREVAQLRRAAESGKAAPARPRPPKPTRRRKAQVRS